MLVAVILSLLRRSGIALVIFVTVVNVAVCLAYFGTASVGGCVYGESFAEITAREIFYFASRSTSVDWNARISGISRKTVFNYLLSLGIKLIIEI